MFKKTPLAAYLTLAFILTIIGLGFFLFPALRLYLAVILGLSYFAWGIVTHLQDKSLQLPIVLEYFAISLLGSIILIFLSLRA